MNNFAKYHGCGNDFIVLNSKETGNIGHNELAVSLCNRNTGIGADGLLIVKEKPDENVPVEMMIYNSDGSLASMCGNGLRCFANYCYDEKIISADNYSVKTGAGVLDVNIRSKDPFVAEVRMGKPDFDPKISGVDTDLPEFLNEKIEVDGISLPVGTFFMGTVHTVVWDEDMIVSDKIAFAEKISRHRVFKEQTNVNIVKVIDRDTISQTTYERGAGLTAACGTGSCASVVYGIRENRLNKKVRVLLKYGELLITEKEDGTVIMEGPAEKIAEGKFFI